MRLAMMHIRKLLIFMLPLRVSVCIDRLWHTVGKVLLEEMRIIPFGNTRVTPTIRIADQLHRIKFRIIAYAIPLRKMIFPEGRL